MAQWWHASSHHQFLHQHLSSYNAFHTMRALSSIAARSFLFPTALEDVLLVPNSEKGSLPVASCPSISCFCDDDPLLPEHLFDKDGGTLTFRTKLEIRYSPWAVSMMDGFGKADKRTAKQFTGYCIAVWLKDETLDSGFLRTGICLFLLLAVAAVRMNNQSGLDAYIIGLGASIGVMLWTGERCLSKKEGSPSGIVSLLAASMAVIFSAALFENLPWHA
ncbi:hypothetical protein GOP47_0020666 [Adiantum capillus-veneris]|uniref:Uncharacterized protein n=1 Tax=Adiantum capillus-veneris TaxID=13818 RepID=A0A9D4U9K1_ADICA|nr:hypothetical protein GOP47_0020666 [Adiantum capillus-veneris]